MTALPYANENTLLIREKSHLEGKNGLLGEHEEPCTKKNQKVLGIAFWSFFLATIIQTIFAIIVNSESLLADSAAMFVDAGTYLCNLIAEKMKTRPPTEEELHLPQVELDNRIRLRRLNLELFPPMISLILLMYVTYDAAGDSIRRIRGVDPTDEEEENAGVAMMFFGGAFLIIDFINMLHFSTTDGALIPLSHIHFNVHYQRTIDIESDHTPTDDESSFEEIDDENDTQRLNLNMYSAWTVSGSFQFDICIYIKNMCTVFYGY